MPARGSVEDRVLATVLSRERAEKYALVNLFVRVIGTGVGVSDRVLDAMLEHYHNELYQAIYDPEFVRQLIQKIDERKKKVEAGKKKDEDILAKVADT